MSYSMRIHSVSDDNLNKSLLFEETSSRDSITSHVRHVSSVRISNSPGLSSFLLLNTMIGSGILNQPYVFKSSGVLGGSVCLLIAAFFTWIGLMALTESGIFNESLEFAGLSKKAFGKSGESLIDICIVLQTFGAQLGYIIVVGQTSSQLLESWGCHSVVCDEYFTTVIMTVLFVAPVCMLRHFGHLAWLSLFSIFAIVLCILLVIIGGPLTTENYDRGNIKVFDAIGTIRSTGSIVFALSCSSANFQAFITTDSTYQTESVWAKVTGMAVTVGAIMCLIMGMGGYLSFGTGTNGEILNNFPQHGFDFFKVMIVIHLVLYIPVNFILMRYSLCKMIVNRKSEDLSLWFHIVITSSLLCIVTFVVLIIVKAGFASGIAFSIILTLTGGVAGACQLSSDKLKHLSIKSMTLMTGSILSFILPSCIYLRLMPKEHQALYTGCTLWDIWGASSCCCGYCHDDADFLKSRTNNAVIPSDR